MNTEEQELAEGVNQGVVVEPTDQTQFVEPTEQIQFVEPTEQTRFVEPTEQIQFVEPTEQTRFVEPTEQAPFVEPIVQKSVAMGNCCDPPAGEYDDTDAAKARNPRTLRRNVCCTDIIVLLIFFAFWCLLVYIAICSIIYGDPRRALFGYDTSGNICNSPFNTPISNLTNSGINTLGKKKVFFMSVFHPLDGMQVCIEKCPDKRMLKPSDVQDFYKRTNVSLCDYGVIPSEDAIFGKTGPCPELPIFESISVMSRCVPNLAIIANETLRTNLTAKFEQVFEMEDLLQKVLRDMYICWKEFIALCAIAVVIAFLMVLMMRFLAAVIVWLIVVLAVIGSLVGTFFLWWTWNSFRTSEEIARYEVPLVGTEVRKQTAFLAFAITATVFTVILLLILFILRKRISLVVALFHEAGKCLADIPLLLIQPLWTFIIFFFVILYFVFILACIATMGTPTASYKKGFPRVKYVRDSFGKQFWWIHLIGLIWTSEFILASQEFIIACSVSIWYFTANKRSLGSPILKSVSCLVLHHMGSIAFGSMIISAVKIIRYILMYIQAKCQGSENACAKCCLKCCICCLWCLEKVLKFLNRNAYSLIAIEGMNFCTAAQRAFEILTSNALRVAAINSVGDFVLFLGKVGVMCLSGVVAVLWLQNIPEIHYVAVPVFLVCVFSFLIAHCFLSVYEMVVDALLICFCEDCQKNDGSVGREYFMSQSLMKYVEDSSSRIDKLNMSQKSQDRTGETAELKPTTS